MNVGSGVVFDKGINMIGPVNLKATVGKPLIINQFGISLFRQFSPVSLMNGMPIDSFGAALYATLMLGVNVWTSQ